MRTFRVWGRRSVPDPRHSVHGFVITVPCPLQVPHVLAMAKNPGWKRIWPEPRPCWAGGAPVPRAAAPPGAGLPPAAVAGRTSHVTRDRERLLATARRLLERDAELVLEVLAA